jgi:type IV secretory pathway VirJ component
MISPARILLLLIVAATCFLAYIGYFGGPVFTDVPARGPRRLTTAAVLLSGDMGFRMGMGPKIADRLAAAGMPVTGVNSLTFFRVRRTPPQTAAMLADAIRHALAQPGVTRVALIGQSFGADALQVGLAGLDPALRSRILFVGLVVPGDTVFYRASPSELFNLEPPDAEALATAQKLDWVPTLCIQGREETTSLCDDWRLPNVTSLALPGGHHLHDDVDAVASALLHSLFAGRDRMGGTHAAA